MAEEIIKITGTEVPDTIDNYHSTGVIVPDTLDGGGAEISTTTTLTPARQYFKSLGIKSESNKLSDKDWDEMYSIVNDKKNKNKTDNEKIAIIGKEIDNRLKEPNAIQKGIAGVTGTIAKLTQDLPEKLAGAMETVTTPIAQLPNNISNLVNSITGKGEQIDTSIKNPLKNYEEIKATFDPNQTLVVDKNGKAIKNGEFIQNVVQGGQDAIGKILLTIPAQQIPGVGQAIASAYWGALSADERIKKNGKFTLNDIVPVLIDTIGDNFIGGALGKILGAGSIDDIAKALTKSTVVEGGTEVVQTALKDLYDFATAKNDAERKEKAQEIKKYWTDPKHGALLEFTVGALSGGISGGLTGVMGEYGRALDLDITPAQQYTPKDYANITADIIKKVPVQIEAKKQAKAIQNENEAVRSIASDLLGYKTRGGDLENSPIDKASNYTSMIIDNMSLPQMERIIKSGDKDAVKTFAKTFSENYTAIQNEINDFLNQDYNRNSIVSGTEIWQEISKTPEGQKIMNSIDTQIQSALNQGIIEKTEDGRFVPKTEAGKEVANKINDVIDLITQQSRDITLSEVEEMRKEINRDFKPNGRPVTNNEKQLYNLFKRSARDKMYEILTQRNPKFKQLAEQRVAHEAMRISMEKALAKSDMDNIKGDNTFANAIKGAIETLDPADVIFAWTRGGVARTGMEAMFGALRGARKGKANTIGKNLIKNIKTLYNARAGKDMTENIVRPYQLPSPDQVSAPIITPYSEVEPQSTAGEKYAIQEEQKAETENIVKNKQQFAKVMADNILSDLQSWLDEPTTDGKLNDIGDRWTKQFYKDYYGEDVKILQQEDNFEALKDRIEELSEQLEEYGDIDKVLEEKAKEDERIAKLNK